MKDKFKVYTNPNMVKKAKKEEITFELEIPDEETITGIFVRSPYFLTCMLGQEYFYYPVDLEAEESMMAPVLSPEVFRDFVENTKILRQKEGIPLAALMHIEVEDEEGENMESIFEGLIQFEFTKFFHTAVMIMNPELLESDELGSVLDGLMEELSDNGYLDQVLNNICEYMSNPEVLEMLLFPMMEEE